MNDLKIPIAELFKYSDEPPNKRKAVPHRIKVNGRYIVSCDRNRKTVWPSIGAAKAAFQLHYKGRICPLILKSIGIPQNYRFGRGWDYKTIDLTWKEFLSEAMKTGFVEFVPFNQ